MKLVICRIGKSSLHNSWLVDKSQRTYKVWLDYYDDSELDTSKADFVTRNVGTSKFEGISNLVAKMESPSGYEAFCFPDDDLVMTTSDIERMFDIGVMWDLDLYQPSLICNASHKITLNVPDSFLRMTNFVEVMCPFFSSRAFEICRDTFKMSKSGWGLDYLWPKLLDYKNIAIVDAVKIEHTKKPGANGMSSRSSIDSCAKECDRIIVEHGLTTEKIVYEVKNVDRE